MDNKLRIYLNRDGSYDAIKGNKMLHYNWSFVTYKIYNIQLITISPSYVPVGRLVSKPHIQMILQVQRSFDGSNESIMNFQQFESLRDKMTPKSEEDIEDAYEDIANKIADILVETDEFDDFLNAYEWAIDHKEIIMEMIGDDGDYSLPEIITHILYGYTEQDTNTKWHDDLDESVRDMMKPISDEDIDKVLANMSYPQVASKLLYAAQEGDTVWAKKILDRGMSPNCQTELGTTPLMFAVMRGHYDLVELLLQRGARVTTKNRSGKTVFDIIKGTPEDFKSYNITPGQKIAFRLYGDKVEKLLQLYRDKQMNESVRDKMTPKPKDDIIESLDVLMRKTARELQYMNDNGDVEGVEDFEDAYTFVLSHSNTVADLVSEFHYSDPEQIALYLSVYLRST